MSRRRHTTVYKGLFGEKHIVTRHEPDGNDGCMTWILAAALILFLIYGCR